MNKLLKGVLWGVGIETAVIALVWVCVRAQNTGWAAPLGALILVLAFAVDFGQGKAKTR